MLALLFDSHPGGIGVLIRPVTPEEFKLHICHEHRTGSTRDTHGHTESEFGEKLGQLMTFFLQNKR